jgi:hypothetical protein
MVKINITVEGEDLTDVISELIILGSRLIKSRRKEIREMMEVFAVEAVDIMMERKMLEKGAQLYRKLNSEINYAYKKD